MEEARSKIDPIERFVLDLQTLAIEFPHVAVTSKNAQYKTMFFNVYFKPEAEKYLSELDMHPDFAYMLAGRLTNYGFTVKFIPRNKHGYCQCSVSKPSGEELGYTEVLTGEAGKMHKAVLSAFAKHVLILREAGEGEFYWAGRQQNTIDGDGFR